MVDAAGMVPPTDSAATAAPADPSLAAAGMNPGTAPAVTPTFPVPAPTSLPATEAAVTWSASVDPPKNIVAWPEKLKWDTPFEGDQNGLLFPSTPSSFLLAGTANSSIEKAVVVDLLTGKVVGKFPTKPEAHLKRALSPDARYVATARLTPRVVEIWSPEAAQPSNVLNVVENDDHVGMLHFRSPTDLVVGGFVKIDGRPQRQLKVYNVENGQIISQLITQKDFDFEDSVISPGGRYLYSVDTSNRVTAFDLNEGRCVGDLPLQKSTPNSDFLNAQDIAVTEDGAQLCIVQTSLWETRLAFVDIAAGKELKEVILPGQLNDIANNAMQYNGQKIQFLRQGEYILLAGQLLVHRKTGRIVWSMTVLPAEDQFALMNDAERRAAGDWLIIADGPRNFPELRTMEIPFDKIEAAMAVVEAKGPATISPESGQVALNIDVTAVRFGDVETTKKELASTLTDRLAMEGLTVSESASAVLTLQYAEGAGNTLSQSNFQPGVPRSQQQPVATGASLESTKALMQLSLKIDKKEVWKKVIELDPSVLFVKGDATAQTARASVFEHVQRALYAIPVVWYVSQEKPFVTLPVLDELASQGFVIGGRRPTRRR
jgi:hypothetical protein